MGYVNFNNVNPYKLEFVEPGLFYKHNDEVESSDIPYYDKHESYERVRSAGSSAIYTVTEYAILKYSEDLYHDEPWVKEVLDRLNDTTKLVSDNPYTTFKPVKEDTANGNKD